MRTLIQRVLSAEVTVEGKTVGKLDRPGLVAFVGITPCLLYTSDAADDLLTV